MCQSLFLKKAAGLRPATLLKKRLWYRCFSVNFAKFLRTSFLTEHLRWLLLELPSVIYYLLNIALRLGHNIAHSIILSVSRYMELWYEQEQHVRKLLVRYAIQLAGGVLLKKLKCFKVILSIFEFLRVCEIVQPYILTGVIKRSQCQLFFLMFRHFI